MANKHDLIPYLEYRTTYGREMATDKTISEAQRDYWKIESMRAQDKLVELGMI